DSHVLGTLWIYRSLARGLAAQGMESRIISRLPMIRRLDARRSVVEELVKAIAERKELAPLAGLTRLIALEPFDSGSVHAVLTGTLNLLGARGDYERLDALAKLLLFPQVEWRSGARPDVQHSRI
ncbi:MAG TPA: hypothetical protein VN920_04805, partial [Pyrinomonadaceae bacterium]|nr:hypothetical protein [Pyrinomonadaceae bacterium]